MATPSEGTALSMNRPFGVPALAGPDRLKAGLQTSGVPSAPVFCRFGNGGKPTESARGLAQSKTLPRNPQVHDPNAGEKNERAPALFISPDVPFTRRLSLAAEQQFGILASYNASPLSHCLLRALVLGRGLDVRSGPEAGGRFNSRQLQQRSRPHFGQE